MKPTYEELEAEVRHLRELLKQALEKIAQLEEQLKRNSKNSSKATASVHADTSCSLPKKEKDSMPFELKLPALWRATSIELGEVYSFCCTPTKFRRRLRCLMAQAAK